uniref:TnpV protein n=1 Tax=Anaeromicropila herbilytica TaxID=2785025 RepID=UPI0038CBFC4E
MEYEERDGLWFAVVGEEKKDNQPLGKYGNQALEYWEKEKEFELQQLILNGAMMETMYQIEKRAEEMMETLQEELLQKDPIKNPSDTMETYHHRQRIHDQAEEIVLHEVIYN